MASNWPTVSIIIPTVARPTLVRCLQSVRAQRFIPGDEVILIGDGPNNGVARELFAQFRLPGYYCETPRRANDWGHTPRNEYMGRATGTHLMAMDDDDEFTAGAVWAVREALHKNPNRPHLFRMHQCFNGVTVWADREIRLGNVGTHMFVIPTAGPRSEYPPYYGGDHAFIRDTVGMYPPGSLVWDETIVSRVRPHAANSQLG